MARIPDPDSPIGYVELEHEDEGTPRTSIIKKNCCCDCCENSLDFDLIKAKAINLRMGRKKTRFYIFCDRCCGSFNSKVSKLVASYHSDFSIDPSGEIYLCTIDGDEYPHCKILMTTKGYYFVSTNLNFY